MTLHEAMALVLAEHGGWMNRDALAREITARDLHRQRAGRPPPSDHLRLRARRYSHLFEGSDPAYTRIRLRNEGTGQRRSRATPAPPAPRHGGGSSTRPTPDAMARARRQRAAASERYRPDRVDLLLVAEAPPAALERYFYFEDVREQDSLFRYVARGVLGIEPARDTKAILLGQLRDRGVFLIDVREDPVDGTPLSDTVPTPVERARALAPRRIVLITATVYDVAFAALRAAGLPVVDERVPFPGSSQQRRFEEAFARALAASSGSGAEAAE